jgi:hypothetical protein
VGSVMFIRHRIATVTASGLLRLWGQQQKKKRPGERGWNLKDHRAAFSVSGRLGDRLARDSRSQVAAVHWREYLVDRRRAQPDLHFAFGAALVAGLNQPVVR